VAKTSHLFTAAKVTRTLEEYETEQVIDAIECDQATRESEVQILALNFREFIKEEPARDRRFDKYVSIRERKRLLSLVDGILPSALGRTPTRQEIRCVRGELQNGVRRYMDDCRNGIPQWLEWY
jgi:hypothetical protein